MNQRTLKDLYDDPALRRELFQKAKRERAAAIRAAYVWLRDRLTPGLHPGHWIGRLG